MALDYYNFDRVLSYNAIFSLCVGGRGIGKSYGMKERMISEALKKGREFIYLRRYKEEIVDSKSSFFSDIAHVFPGYEFRVNGNIAEACVEPEMKENKKGEMVEGKKEWFTIGYFVILSKAQSKKGVQYPKVHYICFDEFIIEKGLIRYLPNEVDLLMNFYNTVDRYRDKARVVLLANGVTLNNPYFIKWRIMPSEGKEFYSLLGGSVVCHLVPGGSFAEQVKKTRFGQMQMEHNKEYAEYAIDNKIQDANETMVGLKPEDARYRYTVEGDMITFTVWRKPDENFYWVQEKRPRGNEKIYTTDQSKMDNGKIFMSRNHKRAQLLRAAYNVGRIEFDSPRLREAFCYSGIFAP